jgi:alkanesulfonate monooxygenase SsuD/methylene tetrahydromethanopterin reductase-like flavin-dependent oxidoreductase (luciferase family)
MNDSELDKIFTYHAPKGAQAEQYEMIRNAAHEFARAVNVLCPESREKSLAITSIQQALQNEGAAKFEYIMNRFASLELQ